MILQKMIFYWILLMSLLMASSSSFWFSLWMTLEMNMMIYIPIMNSKNFLSSNSMLYYYIIQSLSSSMFFMSSLMSTILLNQIFNYIIIIAMMIKLGSAPFHSWYPQISEGLNYTPFFILSTLQKIIPLYIISIFQNNLIIMFIMFSSLMGSLGGLNQTSLKKILAFSSISHMAWIMSLIFIDQNFWMIYFIIYSIILLKIINILNKNNLLLIINLNSMKMSMFDKISLFSFILSLGGLPPFLGFFSKWVAVMLITKKFILILVLLIISSLINLYFYMRCMFPLILNMNIIMKSHNLMTSHVLMYFFIINFSGIILITPWMMTL
nr:NADH dehydrogenase subunit 2 [Ixodes ovatus]